MKVSRAIPISLLFVVVVSSWGQDGDAKSTLSGSQKSHLKVNVTFKEAEPLRGVNAVSVAMITPMQCTADGTSFMAMLQPPEYRNQELLSISLFGNRDVHPFHTEQISDLYDIQQLGYFASGSAVSLLVYASGENKSAKQTVTAQDGRTWQRTGNVGEHHYYVATFDREGKYKSYAQIDDSLRPHTIGLFPSGAMLVSGFSNAHSQLALLKSDGSILRYIDLTKDYSANVESRSAAPGQEVGTSVGREQFIGFQDSIIVVQSGSGLPLLQVTEAGATRTVRTKLPKDLVVDTLLVDDTHLYARAIPKDSKDTVSRSIYEISPQDGSVIQEFAFPNKISSADVAACIHQGNFISFQYGGEGVLIPLLGVPDR